MQGTCHISTQLRDPNYGPRINQAVQFKRGPAGHFTNGETPSRRGTDGLFNWRLQIISNTGWPEKSGTQTFFNNSANNAWILSKLGMHKLEIWDSLSTEFQQDQFNSLDFMDSLRNYPKSGFRSCRHRHIHHAWMVTTFAHVPLLEFSINFLIMGFMGLPMVNWYCEIEHNSNYH